jgi:hypothetical protein
MKAVADDCMYDLLLPTVSVRAVSILHLFNSKDQLGDTPSEPNTHV